MKKFLLLFPSALLIAWGLLCAQTIPNGDFEDWTEQFYFSEPANFWTTNFQAYFSGVGAIVTKTTDAYSGTYALKLASAEVDTHVVAGAIGLGDPGPMGFTGGYPYAELPDTLSGFVKYDIATGDTAFMFVVFTTGGSPISVAGQQFSGVQDTYVQFKAPIMSSLPVEPDTFQFFLSTSADFENAVAGNVFYVDGLHFIGASEPFPNGGFEEWIDVTSEGPDGGWFTSNFFNITGEPSVTKTADAQSGNYAIRLENLPSIIEGPGAFVILGEFGDEEPVGNFPLFDTPKMISGFYKYAPAGPDSSFFFAGFTKWNAGSLQSDSIAELAFSLPAVDDYTQFELPFDIDWIDQPDTMIFGFAPSYFDNDSASITLGSILQVDNLHIEFVSGIILPMGQYLEWVNAYPNPSSDFLYLDFELPDPTPLKVVMIDDAGRNVQHFDLGNRNGSVNLALPVDDLMAGNYYYSILTEKGAFTGKFIVL